ncbi:hypothetical protein DRN94_002960 [archaeon]|nr:hypothetical protein [archaeon]
MSKVLRLLERLELILPGFHGYKQKELIREDDLLVRRHVASLIDNARQRVEQAMPQVVRTSPDLLPLVDSLRKRMLTVAERVRHAEAGYSGYFDRIKVVEDTLEKVLEADLQLVETGKQLVEQATQLASNPQNAAQRLNELLDTVEQTLENRTRILLGVS